MLTLRVGVVVVVYKMVPGQAGCVHPVCVCGGSIERDWRFVVCKTGLLGRVRSLAAVLSVLVPQLAGSVQGVQPVNQDKPSQRSAVYTPCLVGGAGCTTGQPTQNQIRVSRRNTKRGRITRKLRYDEVTMLLLPLIL